MTKEQFKQKYNHVFDLDNKSFDYIPNFGVVGFKSASLPFFIQISLNGEIDKDYLYYIKGDMIWEMDVAFFRNQLLDDTPVKDEETGIYSEPGQVTMGVEKVQKSKLNALKVPSKYLKRYDIDIDEKTVNKSVTVTFPIKTIDVKPIDTYLTNKESNGLNQPYDFKLPIIGDIIPSNVEEAIAKIEQKNKEKGIEIIGDSIYVPNIEFIEEITNLRNLANESINQEDFLPKLTLDKFRLPDTEFIGDNIHPDKSDLESTGKKLIKAFEKEKEWKYKPLITDEDVDNFLNSDKIVVDDFTKVINNRIEHIRDLMIVKGQEYVRNNDRFHNFNIGSALTGECREKVLWGFLLKHIISTQDIINDINKTGELPSKKLIAEKVSDVLCYFLLLECSIEAKRTKE